MANKKNKITISVVPKKMIPVEEGESLRDDLTIVKNSITTPSVLTTLIRLLIWAATIVFVILLLSKF